MSENFDDLDSALCLLVKYVENCHCRGDQYGSPGDCETCVKTKELLRRRAYDYE